MTVNNDLIKVSTPANPPSKAKEAKNYMQASCSPLFDREVIFAWLVE